MRIDFNEGRLARLGLDFLLASWVLSFLFPTQGIGALNVAVSAMLLTSGCLFATQSFVSLQIKSNRRGDRFGKALLAILIVYCLIVIFRGIEFDIRKLFTLAANPDVGGLVWLIPFFAFIGRDPSAIAGLGKTLRRHLTLGLFVFLPTYIFYLSGGVGSDRILLAALVLLYGAPFLALGCLGIQRHWVLGVVGVTCSIPIFLALESRAHIVIYLTVLILALAMGPKIEGKEVARIRLAASGFLVLGGAYVVSTSVVPNLGDSWFIDTRTFIVRELASDFKGEDWIIGRGALGNYFSEHFYWVKIRGDIGDFYQRQVVEIGILHLILKGGALLSVLYYAFLGFAAVRGLAIAERKRGRAVALLLSLYFCQTLIVAAPSYHPFLVMLFILAGDMIYAPLRSIAKSRVIRGSVRAGVA